MRLPENTDYYGLLFQEVELDDSSLIGLFVSGDVAKKLLHFLKQKLPSSCLSDLLCSHAFSKHYLRRGGGSLEDEELLGEGADWCWQNIYNEDIFSVASFGPNFCFCDQKVEKSIPRQIDSLMFRNHL